MQYQISNTNAETNQGFRTHRGQLLEPYPLWPFYYLACCSTLKLKAMSSNMVTICDFWVTE